MIYLNETLIEPTIFPDGTSQVWKLDLSNLDYVDITWEFQYEQEFLHLAQLKDLLDVYCIKVDELIIKYLPYARQDKPISNESTFALRTFSKLLNTLNFNTVSILDGHSKISYNLINNSKEYFVCKVKESIVNKLNIELICYPDQGASTKYWNEYPWNRVEQFSFNKKRDPLTGDIVSLYNVSDIEKIKNKNILIVDDICDGGGTFILVAQKLKEYGCKDIYLYVTYGLFSKGLPPLYEAGIKEIYTHKGQVLTNGESIYYQKVEG